MIEKDVTERCLGERMPDKDVTVTEEGGGYSVPDILVPD